MSGSNSSTCATKDCRTRNFACVLYPESAPDNWQDIIAELKIPFLISPLHDKDINPGGEPKKPHRHIIACFEGKKSIEQVKNVFETFGGVGCEPIQSIRGYARYLCHLDNPEKAQYDTSEVLQFGGADYVSTIGLPTDKYKAIREMMAYCKDNNIVSYAELLDIAAETHFDWFRVLCDNGTVVIKEYLKSLAWTSQRYKSVKIDPDTGEVMLDD